MIGRPATVCVFLAGLIMPAGAWAHGSAPDAEERLREVEAQLLGPSHAAEHARARSYAEEAEQRTPEPEPSFAPAATGNPALDGRWQAPFKIPVIGIHAVMLPTGKVMWFSYRINPNDRFGDPNAPNTAQAWLWNPADGSVKKVDPPLFTDPRDGTLKPANIWCGGQGLTADGRVVVAGGNLDYNRPGGNFAGLNKVFTFNPWNETWTEQPEMAHGRWYPSNALMPDGRMVIMGGVDETGERYSPNTAIELFEPSEDLDGVGTLTTIGHRSYPRTGPGSDPTLPPDGGLYPHLFQMPSGRVMVAGPYRWDSWFLEDPGVGNAFAWTDFADSSTRRQWGTAVLLPDGPGGPTRVQQIGGSDLFEPSNPDLPTINETLTSSETFDETQPGLGWSAGPEMEVARAHHNTVLLPDSSMVTVGGGVGVDPEENNQWAVAGDERQVDLFDPASGEWRTGAAQQEARAYHSTALLMPDGRVISAGDDYHGKNGPGSGVDSDTAEIYEPPYLFAEDGGYADRPVIEAAPSIVTYGSQFSVETPDEIASASLVAPGATTHAVDMNQRVLPLAPVASENGVTLTVPASGAIAPPGWYMLFLMNAEGVPSVARWVLVGESPPALGRIELRMRSEDDPAARVHFDGAPFDRVELASGETAAAAVPGGPSSSVPGGHYTITQRASRRSELRSVDCDDADSQGDVAVRRAVVHVAAGETVVCEFVTRAVPDDSRPPGGPRDTSGPAIAFSRRTGLDGRRRQIRGTAGDDAGVRRVFVSLARLSPRGRCRWLLPRKRRLAAGGRSCARPVWTPAELSRTGSTRVRWHLSLRRSLPAGRYQLAVRSVDAAGNTSVWPRSGGRLALRLRRRG